MITRASVRDMAADHIRRLAAQIGVEDEPPAGGVDGRQEGGVDPLDGDVLHRKSRPRQGLSEDRPRRDPVGVVVVDHGDLPAGRIGQRCRRRLHRLAECFEPDFIHAFHSRCPVIDAVSSPPSRRK